ncbi:site-specific integrase [Sphingomonas xinjiangensis]|uniref:Integrase n=1 Tax=Sphingomonas xinjiangensis TaxID=643568 RepID=A0A840YRK0_9SPHN|nr:site-specific integrase [Sphingomonas xinjiangensis]MBB5712292.1 integrase [Sphingomonas xinjiangensis]
MATPSKDPRTGIFYFRRVVPAALRPFFDGGTSEYKRTLDTRDPEEARQRYHPHAVVYEQKLAAARRALSSQHLRSARAMVDAYLEDTSEQQLQGIAQKLASLEFGAFTHAHGLTDHDPGARYDFGTPPTLDDLRDHGDRKAMLEAIPDFKPLPWLETLQRVAALPSLDPIDWAIVMVAFDHGVVQPIEPPLYEAIGRAFLDRLCAACAPKIDPARTRILPSPILVAGGDTSTLTMRNVEPSSKDAAPTITQVFEEWAVFQPREPKLVDEWRTAIGRFARLHDDPPVDTITASMVRAYRRTCAGLPARAGKKITALPLVDQVELAKAHGLATLSPATVNKALSAVRVTLEHAVEELEVISGNVAKTVKSLPTSEIEDPRLPFEPQDLVRIFNAPLPEKSGVSTSTLCWTLLLAPFTGCRLEELGKLRPGNIKIYDGIPYIAIEPDRVRVREEQEGPAKRVKTASAKRDIPLHPILIEAGFLDMVAKRRDEGAEWLFPELGTNKYGSRTQRLSRVMNDFLDQIGLSDPELVFYSFRHTGKRAIRGKANKEIVDLLFGHADGSVSTQYGRGADMAVLRDAIEKISYPDVDWARVIENARRMT